MTTDTAADITAARTASPTVQGATDTGASAVGASVRRLPRRVPTPTAEPPYDDEPDGRAVGDHRPGHTTRTDGALALETRLADAIGQPAPKLALVRAKPLSRRMVDDETLFGRQPTPTAALPDPRRWAGRLGRAVSEVMCGDRPVTQLMRWTDEAVYADVSRRANILAKASCTRRGARNRVSVLSVHVCEPRDGVAEASVHVRQGHRSRAIALRLEGLDGRWRCTALQLG
jgi:hypothetical protein